MTRHSSLTFPRSLYDRLHAHLFSGDSDEHGAVILAGIAERGGRTRFLARELHLAKDGVDYVDGRYGYKMLKAEFIHPLIRRCREQRLAYIAVHNHGGVNSVGFSRDDFDSHERGYSALLDVAQGMPVGAVVFAQRAIAGDIWFPGGTRTPLDETRVIGANIQRLYDAPRAGNAASRPGYERQVQMFGAAGQHLLQEATVGVIGAGGVGSLLVEYLARLGVGSLLVVDPDRIEISNLSRVVGASRWDALHILQHPRLPKFVREFAARRARLKTAIAARVARQAKPDIRFLGIPGDFSRDNIARAFLDCDFLFLAADTMRARLAFNALVQQYFIPGIQIGSKVITEADGSALESAFGITRWVTPGSGCLWCSDAISPHQLALEMKTEQERRDQDYGTGETNPSVITLNAVGAATAANDFLFSYLGLFNEGVLPAPRRHAHVQRRVIDELLKPDANCPECSSTNTSRFGRGDSVALPTLSVPI